MGGAAVENANAWMGLAAWVVAGALALALGAAAFGCAAYRRVRAAEGRLRALEAATEEFCGALRTRLLVERNRVARDGVEPEAEDPSVGPSP